MLERAAYDTLVEKYGYNVRAEADLEDIRSARNTAEAVGVCWLLAQWIEDEGYGDARDVYDDLSGDRGGRWDLNDNIDIDDDLEVGAVVLNGNVVAAEIWSDDSVVGYVLLT